MLFWLASFTLIAALVFGFLGSEFQSLFPVDLVLPSPSNLTVVDFEARALPIEPTAAHNIEKNTRLRDEAELLFDHLHGVESVTIGQHGSITLLDRYGYLHIANKVSEQLRGVPNGSSFQIMPESVYIGPGRPLGSHYLGASLIVCDSLKGLVEWDGTKITILTNEATYANDLDIDEGTGIVYFSDSQTTPVAYNAKLGFYDTYASAMLGLMSGQATGRVLAFDMKTRITSVLADGLFYSNGVALSKDKDFLLVVETYTMLVKRVWLKPDDRRGRVETFIDLTALGFPDGINLASDGTSFWVAILSPRNQNLIRTFQSKHMRWLISHLPSWTRPKLARQGLILKISGEGEIIYGLWDQEGEVVAAVSAAVEGEGGELWLGNLQGKGVWRVKGKVS